MLNGFCFHGKTLFVTPSTFAIRTLSTKYTPCTTTADCLQCSSFTSFIDERERRIFNSAKPAIIRNAINEAYYEQLEQAREIYEQRQRRGYSRPPAITTTLKQTTDAATSNTSLNLAPLADTTSSVTSINTLPAGYEDKIDEEENNNEEDASFEEEKNSNEEEASLVEEEADSHQNN